METQDLIERAELFMRAVASAAPADEIEAFYAPDVVQEEFPNRLLPNGAVRDLAALREAGEKGRKVMSAQTIEIVNAVGTGHCVAIEAIWTGTLAIAMGNLKPGDQIKARFAQVFEFKDGLIWRQGNYDCFYPF